MIVRALWFIGFLLLVPFMLLALVIVGFAFYMSLLAMVNAFGGVGFLLFICLMGIVLFLLKPVEE